MVESQAREVNEETVLKAFDFAHAIVKDLCNAQIDFVKEYSLIHPLPTKSKLIVKSLSKELYAKIEGFVTEDKMTPLYRVSKTEFHEQLHSLSEEVKVWL
jgi:polyribonucleotide nucleotidyltransferase